MSRKKIVISLTALALFLGAAGIASAAAQDKYALPEPYLAWEKAYLKEFPELQGLMDTMIATAVRQLKAPEGDILHNRVCSALPTRWANHWRCRNGGWPSRRISSTTSARRTRGPY